MKRGIVRFAFATLLMIFSMALSSRAGHAAVVVYLDESGACYGYENPDAYDVMSALAALASPPRPDLVGGKVLNSGVLPGTRVLSIQTVGKTTTVDFSTEIIGNGLGEARMSAIFDQVKNTLYQFGFTGEIALTATGKRLSSYVPAVKPVAPSAEALREQALAVGRPIVGSGLGGRKITVSPGHGYYWNGSGWYTQRPVYCSPLNQEDFHNLEDCQYLQTYLSQDGATVKMVRCTDKNYGNSPYSGSHPWWQMAACYWLANVGYPCSVYGPDGCNLGSGTSDSSNDILSRPLSSDYDASDIYLSMHTNGLAGDCYGSGCPNGTATYYDAGPDHAAYGTVSHNLANAVQSAIVNAIHNNYSDGVWDDRGSINSSGSYGEIRVPQRAAILTELAFHDTCEWDAAYLQDDFFRSTCMWAVYRGVCSYFGTTPTWDYYSCEVVSSDIPATVAQMSTTTVHITLRDRGVLWKEAKQFRLGAPSGSDPFTTQTRHYITGEVGPNTTYTFTFNLTAPYAPGTYTTSWRMLREGVTWFGPTVSQPIIVTGTPDTDPPTVPQNLNADAISPFTVNLSWSASTDNVGVTGYNVYRNDVKIGSTASPAYSDGTCSPNTTYSYQVTAFDLASMESAKSTAAVATTALTDTVPPTVPTNVTATAVLPNQVNLTWTASTDNVAVTGYRVYRNSILVGSSATAGFSDTTWAAGMGYTYQVAAYDAVNNESGWTSPITPWVDIAAPSVPGGVVAAGYATSEIDLTWSASTDNVGVIGYKIYRNGTYLTNVTGTSYADTSVSQKQTFTYAVSAYDAMLNESGHSASSTATSWAVIYQDAFPSSIANWTGGAVFDITKTHTADGSGSAATVTGASGCISYRDLGASFTSGRFEGYLYDVTGLFNFSTQGIWCRVYNGTDYAGAMYLGTLSASPGSSTKYSAGVYNGSVWSWNGQVQSRATGWRSLRIDVMPSGSGAIKFYIDGIVKASQDRFANLNLYGITRNNIGYDTNVNSQGWFDDLQFSVPVPNAPAMGTPSVLGTTSIRWGFTSQSDCRNGFVLHDGSETQVGTALASATHLDETGLAANTQYTRHVHAKNGSVFGPASAAASRYTLSIAPTISNVTCDKSVGVPSGTPTFTFAAVGGFGAGTVQSYGYAWDQSPTHAWTGTETHWVAGSLACAASSFGNWYLHVKGYNGDSVANGTLDLGPYKYDATPPTTPVVTDEGTYTPSTGDLSATWTCSALSGMAGYQYAIRTTSGGDNDVVEWTDVGSASVNRTGLTLTAGTTYYFAVKGQSNTGLWSDVGVSDGIKVVADTDTIPDAKALDNTGHEVALLNKAVTADFGACSYIQEPSGGESEYSAVKLDKGGFAKGSFVNVAGVIGLVDGERVIQTCTIKSGTTGTMPKPIMMINRYIGGYALNDYTPGVSGSQGLNNLGLLVTTMGKLSKPASGNWWYVDDGSGVQYDETYMGTPIDPSLLSTSKKAELVDGASVVVIGICQVGTVNSAPAPILKLRGDGDIVHYP